jgi:hypothetical protein
VPEPQTSQTGLGAKTMLGVGIQPFADAANRAAQAAGPAGRQNAYQVPPDSGAQLPSRLKTVMGVARPGIAPLNPGVPKPAVQPLPAAPPMYAAPVAVPDVTVAPAADPRPGRRMAWIGGSILVTALALLTIAAIASLSRKARVTASVQTTDAGERLDLRCEDCEDGTVASLGGASAKFSGGRAQLPLNAPLRMGNNELELSLGRPDSRSASEVTVTVPVQYRLRGDFAGLVENRPVVRVLIEAVPQTAVVVDGRAIPLDSEGKGHHTIDVASDLSGAAPTVLPLDRTVPYTITVPDAPAHSGEIRLKIGIVPLLVRAPGESIVIDSANFMLAGQTMANGTVTVAGRPITVDAAGHFAQLMSVSAVGETTIEVRAAAPNHAPRLFPLRIKRVSSLKAEAASFSRNATVGLAGVARDPELKKGWAVVLAGTIVEVRGEHHTSVVLMEVKHGCSAEPCLVRLLYGGELPFGKGASVRAFGHVHGAVDGPRTGTKIPEVRAQFFLPE